ncbi:hypothetical protein [Leptospira phage LE4]|uniref:Uncharacterized protein n=1 Tax=Leptospira phage LE4 TaxID=2041383 RepID=A0A343LEH9_9CAUD|nr:hypothetical protein HWB34_gp76 [Leptospira phage LE4]ATN95089.1 hypothetical protein [Leptospira phage LE4]
MDQKINIEEIQKALDKARSKSWNDNASSWMNAITEAILDLGKAINQIGDKENQPEIKPLEKSKTKKIEIGEYYKIDGETYVLDKIVTHTTLIQSLTTGTNFDESKMYHFLDPRTNMTLKLKAHELHVR